MQIATCIKTFKNNIYLNIILPALIQVVNRDILHASIYIEGMEFNPTLP